MPRKQHIVRLSRDDRRELTRLTRSQRTAVMTVTRARILLLADASADGRALTDRQIAAELALCERTVARVRADWAGRGIACVHRKPQDQPSRSPALSTTQALQIASIQCTEPPPGFARWTLRMVTARALELEIVEAVSVETVRTTLKKTMSTPSAPSSVS